MASRRIEDCVPELQEKYHAFAAAMQAAGLDFVLTCTARSYKEQVALYAQGRESLSRVNMYRIVAGLPVIGKEENDHKVTWTLRSKHVVNLDDNDGQNDLARAFDIALVKHTGGKPVPHWRLKEDVNGNAVPDYDEAGRIGEAVGLRWGGRFPSPDRPHFEV
jgi:hypothetical protein